MSDRKTYRERVVAVATRIVAGRMVRGEIEQSDEAIREAMPSAVKLAREVVTAAEEFVS